MSKARGLADLGNAYNDGALSNRNVVLNGAMNVAQRGTSFSSGGAIYTLDRWEIYPGANPGVVDTSRVQFNASDDMLVVSGFNYYLNTVYSTGVGGAAYDNRHFRINQENAYFYAGKTFTISFWAKSDTNRKLGLETRLNAGATEDTLHKSVLDASGWQLSTSWQYFTHTFTIPALVTTSASIEASVASFYITADPVSTGATYDITGVQLEVGDTATPFEHRSYAQELALCQRFYQECIIKDRVFCSYNNSSASYGGSFQWRTVMRAAPTAQGGTNAMAYPSNDPNAVTGKQVLIQTTYAEGCQAYLNYDTVYAHTWFVRADSLLLDAEL
jgi:hypothetical protein